MDSDYVEPVEDDIYHVVREPEFTALFMLGTDDAPETVEDVDAELRLPDGTRWSASFMTLGACDRNGDESMEGIRRVWRWSLLPVF